MEKFNLLLDMGYSIGNHTNMHADFMILPREKWENAVILPMVKFHRRLGLRTSEIFAMAYPWGRFPKGGGAEEYMAGFQFNGRDAVRIGFLANGSVSSMRPLLDWRNIITTSPRDDLHDPLRPRIP